MKPTYDIANTLRRHRLLRGEPEQTTGIVYRVTEDGRRAADHERPAIAGSGEKRGTAQVDTMPMADAGEKDEPSLSEEELGVTDRT